MPLVDWTHRNYRVMEFQDGAERWLAIHEVYYRGDQPVAFARDPSAVVATNGVTNTLCAELVQMREAILKPVLHPFDFPFFHHATPTARTHVRTIPVASGRANSPRNE